MPDEPIKVLIASPEAAPLAQTGGLAEVVGSLPRALAAEGCQVAVVLPAYRSVLERGQKWKTAVNDLPVRLGASHLTADVLTGELGPDIPAFLIRRDEFFDRTNLYGNSRGDYFDNPERFIFFSRAVPVMCPNIGFIPDIILANDWQTGLIMPLLHLGALPRTAGVFTIHNQGYLGLVPHERTHNIGLPERFYELDSLEYYGQMSLLKAGIVYAQAVTTVSPTYAREIQTPESGHGLDGLMRSLAGRLHGILNGVDYTIWNPAVDPHIVSRYSPDDLGGKEKCKKWLLEKTGLAPEMLNRPLIGIVSRLAPQKGTGLLAEAADDLFKLGIGLVVLGEGERWNVETLMEIQDRYPGLVSINIGFDVKLAHEIIAGCDMLLMPSMYEPCGLAQMYGLRYGTVPIVRATGGLNDTIHDPKENKGTGTGFKFNIFQPLALGRAVRRAVETYQNRELWVKMMRSGMSENFSWDQSAREYVSVFKEALIMRRGKP